MKKQISVFVMLVLAVLVLAGCPKSLNPQDVDAANDAVDAVSADTAAASVTMPSSVDNNPFLGSDNPYAGVIDIPNGMGAVTVSGSFYDKKSLEKSANLNDVVDAFKTRAAVMEFTFYPVEPTTTTPVQVKGGGGWGEAMTFTIPIKDGEYSGKFLLLAGDYQVYVNVYDGNHNYLFNSNTFVTVIIGRAVSLDIWLYLNQWYSFNFKMPDLPGYYNGSGNATIITASGESYSGSFYLDCWDCGMGLASDVVFSFWLPVTFDGADSGAVLLVSDADGYPYASNLSFNVLDVGSVFKVAYDYPEQVGGVDVNIHFAEYPEDGGKG